MEFLQPVMLWGLLALALPVIIHFWYQKKGTTLDWAATRWLTGITNQQQRGLRPDELLLLLLRCLLVVFLVLLLSKPMTDILKLNQKKHIVHLVQPDSKLVSNFRFELENALRKGEKVYWAAASGSEAKDLSDLPKVAHSELYLQKNINRLSKPETELHLYVVSRNKLANLPRFDVPQDFKLHALTDTIIEELPKVTGLNGKKMTVLIDYQDASESRTVEAALDALAEVYGISFAKALSFDPKTKYDWILTDQKISNYYAHTLYVISDNTISQVLPENVVQFPDSLLLRYSEIVQNGALPEWLGAAMISHLKLDIRETPLSRSQLETLFVRSKPLDSRSAGPLYQYLLLLFMVTLLAERWIALKKTAARDYA